MSVIRPLMVTLALLLPVSSYADAVDESIRDRVVQDHQRKVANYAKNHKKTVPGINEYRYGMELDIARVIVLSQDPRTCKVVPQLMTYENSIGELMTLKYQMLSDCRGKN